MKVLIIGSGGREHALGWKLKQSPQVKKIYFAPGNGGTEKIGENIKIAAEDIKKLLKFALTNEIDLTVVGPEAPLALGIVDVFLKKNLLIFGPTKKAALLESNKAWANKFMKKYHIPHPQSFIFSEYDKAVSFLKTYSGLVVVKASGLALGKGVVIPKNKKEAIEAVKKIMVKREFGEAGNKTVIQEKLDGQEISILAFTDGKTIIPLLAAQDHKRIFDQDKGPNTGGMGAYAPVPLVTKKLINEINTTILKPTILGMKKEGAPYKGVLYAGLMITKNGPKVLEYNCRFGDPEVQPLLMLLRNDLLPLILACVKGRLSKQKIAFKRGSSICVVLASKGYPGHYQKGKTIDGLNIKQNHDLQIFHAGTIQNNNQTLTSSGRVLGVTGYGKNLKEAIKKVYKIIGKNGVNFEGMQYRKDIAQKALLINSIND